MIEVLANYGVMGGSHLEGKRMDANVGLVGADIFRRYLVTRLYQARGSAGTITADCGQLGSGGQA
jgi:hypothetical protein